MKFQAIKGVRDILPAESALWNRVEQTAREVFATYGYGEIRLPIFEQTDLFARSVGEESDIVSKEMYSFKTEDGLPERPSIQDLAGFTDWVKKVDIAYERGEIQKDEYFEKQLSEIKYFLQQGPDPGLGWEVYRRVMNGLAFGLDDTVRSQTAKLLSLRPEATASVCRAYIEHGMHTLPGNVKLYYIGPMFRRERPQKGRYRQFYQIGAEVLGQSDAPAIDAEVIEMLMAFFERAGLRSAALQGGKDAGLKPGATTDETTLYINSIGCKECRPKYVEKLRAALVEHINELKADSQRRVETNPLRVLDSKLPEEQAVIEKLPRITEHLCDACREHYGEVKKQLELRGVAYQENWRLVRGLDYYMRTTFEITAPGLGAQNAVCGGGRYDGLVELLGGPATKGIGFAIGTDRLILSLQEAAKQQGAGGTPALQELDVFIAWMGAVAQPEAVKIARTLREAGFSVEVPAEEMKFKKSIGLADKLGARFALIIGENEIAEGKYALKRLSDGVQEKVSADELIAAVRRSNE
ncbi:MAG: histidine--tRNA ligase [Acidobacteria bacterium]|nr:histidine--tRNA ligase [Acidobacteriota bacterium]MCL5286985.1 histidine--tRNA ligase [Acidobacteriota bacterium]